MASIDIDIEDYLDEVSTRFLEKELERRTDKSTITQKRLELPEYFKMKEIMAELGIDNMPDVCKFEHFIKKFKDIPEVAIDNFLNQY